MTNGEDDLDKLFDIISTEDAKKLLEVDNEEGTWTFSDVPLDTGTFGKLVNTEFVQKRENEYTLSNPAAIQEALTTGSEKRTPIKNLPSARSWLQSTFISDIWRPYVVALIVIMIIGLSLRLYQLGSASFWGDESWTVWAAYNFMQGQGFTEPAGAPYWRSWLTVGTSIAAMFWIFGTNELAARLPSVVVGTATLPVAYLFGRKLVNRPAGLLLAGVLAMDPWALTWSREARMYAHFQLIFLLGLLLFYLWYSEDALEFTSKWGLAFVALVPLGYSTHRGFLLIGPTLFVFLTLSLAYHTYLSSIGIKDVREQVQRHITLIGGMLAGAALFITIKGIPDVLKGQTPAWYGGTETNYYWKTFETLGAVPDVMTEILLWSGIAYLLISNRKRGLFVVVAFAVPYLIQTYLISWRIQRYIFYVYPIYLLICLSILAEMLDILHVRINKRLKSSQDSFFAKIILSSDASKFIQESSEKITMIVVVLVIIVIIQAIVPIGGSLVFLSENPHGTLENRPDYKGVSNYLDGKIDSKDTLVVSTPQLATWYLGQSDYSLFPFRYVINESGVAVDQRTGAIVLNNSTEVYSVISRQSGWIIADHRLWWYADESVHNTVRHSAVRVDAGQWNDISLYRFGPTTLNANADSNQWRSKIERTKGNVYSNSEAALMLGRAAETQPTWGTNTGDTTGSVTFLLNKPETQSAVVELVVFTNKESHREVQIEVSGDGEHWQDVPHRLENGWRCYQIKIPTESFSNKYYLRLSDNSESGSQLGIVIKRMTVHPYTEAVSSDFGSTSSTQGCAR